MEVHDEGRRHVYRAVDPPDPDPQWSAIIGDAIHNLRSALDHLAHDLVRLCGNERTNATAFPILSRAPRSRWIRRRQLPDISGGVSKDIRKRLETVQPYMRRDAIYTLGRLRDLDNIDKHRTIVAVSIATGGHITTYDPGNPPPEPTTQWTRRPLKHDEVVGILIFDEPQAEPDPNLEFLPHIAFGVGEPLAGIYVPSALSSLRERVKEAIDMFTPMFPT